MSEDLLMLGDKAFKIASHRGHGEVTPSLEQNRDAVEAFWG